MNVNLTNSLNQVPTGAAPRQEVNAPQGTSTKQKITHVALATLAMAASLAVIMGGILGSLYLLEKIIIPSELGMGIFSAMSDVCFPIGEKLALMSMLSFNSITTMWIAPPAIITAAAVRVLPYTPAAMIVGLGALPGAVMMVKSQNYMDSIKL